MQLEELVKQVVSPFLGISEDRSVSGPTYTLGKGHGSQAARSVHGNDTSYVLPSPDYTPSPLLPMWVVQISARPSLMFPTDLCLGNLPSWQFLPRHCYRTSVAALV